MKLIESKIIRGGIGGTRMEWFCGEFEEQTFGKEREKPRFIGCFDVTIPSNPRSIFFIHKGQPPEQFDFKKRAYSSYEQIAMSQIVSMDWDKLGNGDKITVSDEMEKRLRDWRGRIWLGGSEATIEEKDGIHHIKNKKIPLEERDIGRYIAYKKQKEEY